MKTTIDIPEKLVKEAMRVSNLKTKTDAIKEGLITLIRKEKLKRIKDFRGKLNLHIEMDAIRVRWFSDLMIAQNSIQNNIPIFTLDKHYELMKEKAKIPIQLR